MKPARVLASVVTVGLFAVSPASVPAHHGWSGYDAEKALNFTGVIKESGYEHPHGFLRLETPSKIWLVVLAPPTRMQSRGLPATMLAPGTTAKVEGYPHRANAEEMRAERITIDGKTVELR